MEEKEAEARVARAREEGRQAGLREGRQEAMADKVNSLEEDREDHDERIRELERLRWTGAGAFWLIQIELAAMYAIADYFDLIGR